MGQESHRHPGQRSSRQTRRGVQRGRMGKPRDNSRGDQGSGQKESPKTQGQRELRTQSHGVGTSGPSRVHLVPNNKGPQHSWHTASTRDQTTSAPSAEKRRPDHIVFQCQAHQEERQEMGDLRTWVDLDKPIWRGEGKDRHDTVEDFFLYCNHRLTQRH